MTHQSPKAQGIELDQDMVDSIFSSLPNSYINFGD